MKDFFDAHMQMLITLLVVSGIVGLLFGGRMTPGMMGLWKDMANLTQQSELEGKDMKAIKEWSELEKETAVFHNQIHLKKGKKYPLVDLVNLNGDVIFRSLWDLKRKRACDDVYQESTKELCFQKEGIYEVEIELLSKNRHSEYVSFCVAVMEE